MNKPSYPHPIIAREGWPFVALALLLAVWATLWPTWLAVPLWLLALAMVMFFRDPPRMAPDAPMAVLSPADGRIVAVEQARDLVADRDALKISVHIGLLNSHANRIPVTGTVARVQYFPGRKFNATLDKSSLENERNAVVIHTNHGHHVTAVQIAGTVARRILCHVHPGDVVTSGQRYGFIRFGSRVDVYLPPSARPRVAIGDKVSATSTVLADLPSDPLSH